MTKSDLMQHWDEIVCDRRLTLSLAADHVERVGREGPAYLLGEYHALATGGTTGTRGILVLDFEGFRLAGTRAAAWGLSISSRLGDAPEPPITTASIGSSSPVHFGGAFNRCFSNPAMMRMNPIAASEPIERICERLEEIRPGSLMGYASILHELAERKLAGRLDIEPRGITQLGEPFLPEARAMVSTAFGGNVRDVWGATEIGLAASSYPGFEGLAISEDLVVIEPVDAEGRPVAIGERAAKVFATNLTNRVLPIIRYEITDELTLLPPDLECPWSGHRIAQIHGRQDDVFEYAGSRRIHPHTFRSVLTHHASVAEYQVRQTRQGADVVLVSSDAVDLARVEGELVSALRLAGLERPSVSLERVTHIDRHPNSQKLKRFVPLS
jgi:phenylacetate-coenzyme A ligase PaaK-like adenylate-forming protein